MQHILHTKFIGTDLKQVLPREEISGSFSITKDGLHFEIVSFGGNLSFKIFDLSSTRLLHEGELKDLVTSF